MFGGYLIVVYLRHTIVRSLGNYYRYKVPNGTLYKTMFSFDQLKNEFIGEIGTKKKTLYEQELQFEVRGGNKK